jgi:hypothetical protein
MRDPASHPTFMSGAKAVNARRGAAFPPAAKRVATKSKKQKAPLAGEAEFGERLS